MSGSPAVTDAVMGTPQSPGGGALEGSGAPSSSSDIAIEDAGVNDETGVAPTPLVTDVDVEEEAHVGSPSRSAQTSAAHPGPNHVNDVEHGHGPTTGSESSQHTHSGHDAVQDTQDVQPTEPSPPVHSSTQTESGQGPNDTSLVLTLSGSSIARSTSSLPQSPSSKTSPQSPSNDMGDKKPSSKLPVSTPNPPARPTLDLATPSPATSSVPRRSSQPPSYEDPIGLRAAPEFAEFDPFAAGPRPALPANAARLGLSTLYDSPASTTQHSNASGQSPNAEHSSAESPKAQRPKARHPTAQPPSALRPNPKRLDSDSVTELTYPLPYEDRPDPEAKLNANLVDVADGPKVAEPTFNFNGFCKDLRRQSADPINRYYRSFVTSFAKRPFTVNEQIKLIRDFMNFISDKMSQYEPWKSQSPAQFDLAVEAMEKLVMNRLFPYTFTPQLASGHRSTTDDLERDAVFAQRVRLFKWIEAEHLEIPAAAAGEQAQGLLTYAASELSLINRYKAPRDKVICILNCCKIIFSLIKHMSGDGGADQFMPLLIVVVLRAAPINMWSNIEYITRFRNPDKLLGEAGYYISSLQGAMTFIETMDWNSLANISQEEFEFNVEKAIQELPMSPTSESPFGDTTEATNGLASHSQAAGEEPARQLQLPPTAAALDGTRRFFQRTGDAAKEAVSRPLIAIGKILDGMQQPQAERAEVRSESGESASGDETVGQWAPGGPRDREHEQRAHRSNSSSMSVSVPPRYPQSHPSQQHQPGRHGQAGLAHNAGPPPLPTREYHGNPPPTFSQYPGNAEPPSRMLAQLGLSPSVSESVTPREPTPDYGSHVQQQIQQSIEASSEEYARNQARLANVMTLRQMFPAFDYEVVDAVLFSCGDDLGVAIDRLLEM